MAPAVVAPNSRPPGGGASVFLESGWRSSVLKRLRIAFLTIVLLALGWGLVEQMFGEQTRLVVTMALLLTTSGLICLLVGLLAKKTRRNR